MQKNQLLSLLMLLAAFSIGCPQTPLVMTPIQYSITPMSAMPASAAKTTVSLLLLLWAKPVNPMMIASSVIASMSLANTGSKVTAACAAPMIMSALRTVGLMPFGAVKTLDNWAVIA